MPIVQIELVKGRTLEQKRNLVEKVTEAISETVNCPKDNITIILRDMETENVSKGGKLFCDK